jgi:hypothetical protein
MQIALKGSRDRCPYMPEMNMRERNENLTGVFSNIQQIFDVEFPTGNLLVSSKH